MGFVTILHSRRPDPRISPSTAHTRARIPRTKDEVRRDVTLRQHVAGRKSALGGVRGGAEGQETGILEKGAGGREEGGKHRCRGLTIVGAGSSWFQTELFTSIVLHFMTEDVRSSSSARHASDKITTHIYTLSENARRLSQVSGLVRGGEEMR